MVKNNHCRYRMISYSAVHADGSLFERIGFAIIRKLKISVTGLNE